MKRCAPTAGSGKLDEKIIAIPFSDPTYNSYHDISELPSHLFMCWEILVGGAYAGFGNTLPSSVVSIVFTGLRIPAAMALSATALGLNGVWWSLSISSILKGVILTGIFLVFLARLPKKQSLSVQ